MSDRDPIWDALKAHSREKFNADRQRFMEAAVSADDGGWTKHTDYHWSRDLMGQRLNYWPSRKKYQLGGGKVMRGDVQKFIAQKQGSKP